MSSDNPSAWQHRVSVGDVINEAVVTNTTPDPAAYGLVVRTIGGGSGGGPATIADGADVAEGATTDAAVTTDTAGTVSSKLRGLVKILGDVWDSVNHLLRVSIQNASIAVTGSLGRTWTLGSSTDSVTAVQSTAANLNATVTGSVSVSNFPATQPVSGTVTANQGGSPWQVQSNSANIATSAQLPTALDGSGFLKVHEQGTATVSGTVTSNQGSAPWTQRIQDGTTSTLAIVTSANALKVDGSAVTQPVSEATLDAAISANKVNVNVSSGSVTVTQSSGANLHADIDNFPASQTVAGTVTGNQGSPNTPANSWPVEVTDGTNVLGTSTHPVRVDPTGTTTQPISGSVSVSNFPATQPISGSVSVSNFPSPQIVAGSNTPADNVTNPTNAVPDEALLMGWDVTNSVWRRIQVDTATGTLKVDGSGSTQPVSGSVSVANFPATQTVSGSVSVSNFPSPQTVTGSNTPADNVTNPTNTIPAESFLMAWDSTNSVWRRVQVDAATGTLKVDSSGFTQPISGSVTVTQASGSNLHVDVDSAPSTVVTQSSGANLHVDVDSAPTTTVTGTVTANAGTGNFTVVQSSGLNLHVDVDNFPATQAVSGTVTANQGGSPWQVQSNSANLATASQLPSALDSSGFLQIHEEGTAKVDMIDRAARLLGVILRQTGDPFDQDFQFTRHWTEQCALRLSPHESSDRAGVWTGPPMSIMEGVR